MSQPVEESPHPQPWEVLHQLIEERNSEALETFLESLPANERARGISRLSDPERSEILRLLHPEEAAWLLEELPAEQVSELIEDITPQEAAEIFRQLPSDEQADILGDLDEEDSEAILDAMPEDQADKAREILNYDAGSAGGLMLTDFVSYREVQTVGDVVDDLAANQDEYTDYDVQYVYVTDTTGRLRGVLRLRDLVMSRRERVIRDIMIPEPLAVKATDELDFLVEFFSDHHFLGVPVIDEKDRLVGVLRETDVDHAVQRRAEGTFLRFRGIIGGEELRSRPLHQRCVRRLSWLAPNIVLNLVAASVISLYQDTLQEAIVLAIFLPIISDMSGCSGNQAVAVSIRELALGLIKPKEVTRVFLKEGLLGVINGVVLGILLGTIAALWQGNPYLGVVVGAALALNTTLSVLLGGLVPLILKGFKIDPALASGPLLTTVTDMCGFFLVLSFATLMLDKL